MPSAVVASLVLFLAVAPSLARAEAIPNSPDLAALVDRVDAAGKRIASEGEAAFPDLSTEGGPWRRGDDYIFVLTLEGTMVVHPDPSLVGKDQRSLEDVNGRPIIRGLIDAVTATSGRTAGWYHYQWPVPGGLLPRWKSSYVRLVTAPNQKHFIVGSGVYDDRMDRVFVADLVEDAAARIERDGKRAFELFYDPKGSFLVKDAYVFVIDRHGVDMVNPAFRNLEGHSLLDLKDRAGTPFVCQMLTVTETGPAWVEYLWPKPGEHVPTRKTAYVRRAKLGEDWVLVGCGAYLADAPKAAAAVRRTTARALVKLVNEASALLSREGENGYAQLRRPGSKWRHDDLYFFAWTLGGTRTLHVADPGSEGEDVSGLKDAQGRPIGPALMEVGRSKAGEGWVHYLYPKTGDMFPAWKSSYIKRVRFPSGVDHLVGAGVYEMQLDRSMVQDLVDRASALVVAQGRGAFPALRDPTGPYRFMDTYVFVDSTDGVELVNPAQPRGQEPARASRREGQGGRARVHRHGPEARLRLGDVPLVQARREPPRAQTLVRPPRRVRWRDLHRRGWPVRGRRGAGRPRRRDAESGLSAETRLDRRRSSHEGRDPGTDPGSSLSSAPVTGGRPPRWALFCPFWPITVRVSIMGRPSTPPLPSVARSLESLGEHIRLARLRRGLSAELLAERAGLTRTTLRAIERGTATVTLGAYANVLHALGLAGDLARVAETDPVGRHLQDAALEASGRARPRRRAPREAAK